MRDRRPFYLLPCEEVDWFPPTESHSIGADSARFVTGDGFSLLCCTSSSSSACARELCCSEGSKTSSSALITAAVDVIVTSSYPSLLITVVVDVVTVSWDGEPSSSSTLKLRGFERRFFWPIFLRLSFFRWCSFLSTFFPYKKIL